MPDQIHPDAPNVVLYSKPLCGQCIATAKALTVRGIPFVKIDVTEDENAAGRVRGLGYQSLPVVTAGDMHWSGFQLTKIDQLAAALRNWTPSAPVEEADHAVCKHCNGPIHRSDKTTTRDWVHSDGDHVRLHTCPVDPYGFHAEPVGTACGDHPANPCNGARGMEVRTDA